MRTPEEVAREICGAVRPVLTPAEEREIVASAIRADRLDVLDRVRDRIVIDDRDYQRLRREIEGKP